MRTENELRDLFRTSAPPVAAIDTAVVLSRSRRRRLPKRVALGGTVTLAAASLGVAGFSTLSGKIGQAAMSSSDSAGQAPAPMSESGPGSASSGDTNGSAVQGGADPDAGGISRAPAEKVNACGGTLAEVAPSESGLELTPLFDTTTATGGMVEGTVRLTNTGSARVTGTTPATPAVTLSQGGVVLWHSNGPMIMMVTMVDLAPGESLEYRASFLPVRCAVEDDVAEAFRTDLPALPAGEYEVSALIDFTPSAEAAVPTLVSGPVVPVSLR